MDGARDGARPSFFERLRARREETRALGVEAAGMIRDLRHLLQLQRELARAEANEARGYAARGAGFGAAAGFMLLFVPVFLFLAIMFALETAMARWLAALITSGIILLIAATLGLIARSQLRKFSPLPRRFMRGIREDILWARDQAEVRTRSIRKS